jgi:ribosome maturation factor RimP
MTSDWFGKLKKTVSIVTERLGYECVKVGISNMRAPAVLRVYIDSPDGIKHSDCEEVSRAISECLDSADKEGTPFFAGKYSIEVSSPGIERPLFTEEHYARFTGREVSVSTKSGGVAAGVIISCDNGVVTLRTDSGDVTLSFGDIKKGNLVHKAQKNEKMGKDNSPKHSRRGTYATR